MIRILLWKFINIFPKRLIIITEIEKISQRLLGRGCYFGINKEISFCLSLLKTNPKIFIDIGANKGSYTKSLLKRFPTIECHLFEPSEINFQELKNKFPGKNIFINKKALSKTSEERYLYSDKPGSGLSSLTKRDLNEQNISFDIEEKVDVIRFDEYWTDLTKKIDFVKIDVEGHELDVLKGFGDLIYKIRVIQFEFGGTDVDTRTFFKDFWIFFKEKNFSIYRMSPLGLIRIKKYNVREECFVYSNFIALNKSQEK